jgi:hypothetical protein
MIIPRGWRKTILKQKMRFHPGDLPSRPRFFFASFAVNG